MSDRVWLITGASRGIGAEIARAVLTSGDRLIATSRNLGDLAHLGTAENLYCGRWMSTTRATRIALCKQVSRGLDASTFS